MSWMNNGIHCFVWDVILMRATHPYLHLNGGITLKLWDEWAVTHVHPTVCVDSIAYPWQNPNAGLADLF